VEAVWVDAKGVAAPMADGLSAEWYFAKKIPGYSRAVPLITVKGTDPAMKLGRWKIKSPLVFRMRSTTGTVSVPVTDTE
jgi:hypothetical protein